MPYVKQYEDLGGKGGLKKKEEKNDIAVSARGKKKNLKMYIYCGLQ